MQFCEFLTIGEGDIFGRDDLFLASERSPIHIPTSEILDDSEIPVYSSIDAYSVSLMSMIENSKSDSFLKPNPAFSPAYYTDPVVAKDSPASLSSADGSSPFYQLAYPPWDADDESPVTVINPALIARPEGNIEKGEESNVKQEDKTEISDIALRIEGTQVHNSVKQENINEDSDFTLQLAGSRIHSSLPPLDLISLRSYDVLNIPMKKICRGRRVPTVEMVQKRAARTVVDVVEKKPGRDTFAERRFVCGFVECRKCFKRREHLIRHQRSAHSSEKPFQCPIVGCYVSCNRKDNMHQHIRNAHWKNKPAEA